MIISQRRHQRLLLCALILAVTVCLSPHIVLLADTPPAREPVSKESLQKHALFLSGKYAATTDKRLEAVRTQDSYRYASSNLAKSWTRYRNRHHDPLTGWIRDKLPRRSLTTAFYPFSGPDLPNVFAVYPDAETYLLIGLEPAGTLPDYRSISDRDIARGMQFLFQLLDAFSEDNYFHTKEMGLFGAWSPSFAGATGLLLAFMGLMDLEPLSYRPFLVDYNGSVQPLSWDEKEHRPVLERGEHSVEIGFRVPRTGAVKRVIYLSADISNMRAIDRNPGIFIYLDTRMPEHVLIKAASYLLHLDNYRTMKSFILRKARTIVMDDTGPRIADFGPEWTIEPYGEYKGTVELFSNRAQPDLAELFRARRPALLPFTFGYGIGSRLLIVTRK